MKKTAITSGTRPVSFRFSILARVLLERLATQEGLNATAYLETTLRRIARQEGVDIQRIENELKGHPSSDSDEYWIRLGEEGHASGYASPAEAMRRIQARLDRDDSLVGQA